MMKISVVMTTYNGSEHIMGQLISIRDQTRKPDEVLIFDDCSTDNTTDIVTNFIQENKLYEWTLVRNERNKGWKKNFADGINSARGDIIFLSDQDDIWDLQKINIMSKVLEKSDQIGLLSSNYHVRYEKNARRIKSWLLKPYGKDHISQVELTGFTYDPIRPGCAYAFKKDLIPLFNTIWKDDDPHDRVLWDCALLTGKLYIINEKLLTQVRYGGNQTPTNQLTGAGREASVRYRREFAERFLDLVEDQKIKDWLIKYIEVAHKREDALINASVIKLIKTAKDRDYTPLPITWMLDINAALQKKIRSISHK